MLALPILLMFSAISHSLQLKRMGFRALLLVIRVASQTGLTALILQDHERSQKITAGMS